MIFAFVETKVAEPLFRISLFKIRAFAAGNLANLMLALGRGGMQFMLIIWLQGIWLPLHGYSFSQTPLWAGIYLVPLTIGFLLSAPLSGVLSDRFGAKGFTTGGALLTALTFFVLLFLPVNFSYWEFALIIALNGFGSGLFASPNRAEMMNAVPGQPARRGRRDDRHVHEHRVRAVHRGLLLADGGRAVQQAAGRAVRRADRAGRPGRGRQQISHLPPIGVLFAAFLGYNPMQQLLGPLLGHLPAAHAAYVTGRQFFPHLITAPFHCGLGVAFAFAIAASLIAAVASAADRPPPGGRGRAAEPLGAELAAVAGDAGLEPSEIVGAGRTAKRRARRTVRPVAGKWPFACGYQVRRDGDRAELPGPAIPGRRKPRPAGPGPGIRPAAGRTGHPIMRAGRYPAGERRVTYPPSHPGNPKHPDQCRRAVRRAKTRGSPGDRRCWCANRGDLLP